MIQRIQTLYLLGAAGLVIAMFFMPVASFLAPDGSAYSLGLDGITGIDGTRFAPALPLLILFSITGILLLTDMFLYRNRVLQMRVGIYTILVLVGAVALEAYYIWFGKQKLEAAFSLKIAFIFPLVAAVLTYLAYRNIRKDEELVRAYDRIR